MKKYKTFSVAMEKELESNKKLTYSIKFINSVKPMARSLLSFAANLAEGLQSSKCKDCKSCLKYVKTKDKLIIFKCLKRNKIHNNFSIKNRVIVKRFARLNYVMKAIISIISCK